MVLSSRGTASRGIKDVLYAGKPLHPKDISEDGVFLDLHEVPRNEKTRQKAGFRGF